MIKSVYFGYRVVDLNQQQEKELQRIYKESMLMKLGLMEIFPRKLLYVKQSALGVELVSLEIVTDMLVLKLYIRNKRKLGNTVESIVIQEKCQEVDAGREVILGKDLQLRYWTKTWIDEVNDELWKRDMTLRSSLEVGKKQT